MLVKRSISLSGHRTSIALEPAFWAEVERLAKDGGQSLAAFIRSIDADRAPDSNLASALRLVVLADLNQALARERSTRIDPAA
jgi:predicted DNA-binding ribbon-helix-helix protein